MAGWPADAIDGDDVALAAKRIGQPLGRLHRPALLVDADVDGVLGRHLRVGGDDQDALGLGLSEDRIEGRRAVRVDDDGVDALIDEVADVADLALHVDVGRLHDDIDGDALVGPRLGSCLRLLDHLGAPLAADPAVRQANGKSLGRRRRTDRGHGDAGR